MRPEWIGAYVGLPYEPPHGCWALCARVWREQYGLEVPTYDEQGVDAAEHAEMAALVARERGPWSPVAPPRPGDAALFRIGPHPIHIGVIVDPPWFLHAERDLNAVLDRYDGIRWGRRFLGAYRHAALA